MRKIFLFLIIALFFSDSTCNSEKLKTYIIEPYQTGKYEDHSACVCLKLHIDTKKESNPFYLSINADKQNDVKVDKVLYYEYIDSCDNQLECYNDTYKNLKTSNNIKQEYTDSKSFYYEYTCDLDDDKHRGMFIQYKDFTGKEIIIQYSPFSGNGILVAFLVIVGIIIFIIIIIIIFACRYCQKKKQERINAEYLATHQDGFNNTGVPIVPEDNQALFPGQYQAIVPQETTVQENQAIVPQ